MSRQRQPDTVAMDWARDSLAVHVGGSRWIGRAALAATRLDYYGSKVLFPRGRKSRRGREPARCLAHPIPFHPSHPVQHPLERLRIQ